MTLRRMCMYKRAVGGVVYSLYCSCIPAVLYDCAWRQLFGLYVRLRSRSVELDGDIIPVRDLIIVTSVTRDGIELGGAR